MQAVSIGTAKEHQQFKKAWGRYYENEKMDLSFAGSSNGAGKYLCCSGRCKHNYKQNSL